MSDEEKKAIKEIKHFNQLTRYWQEEEYEEKEIAEYITTILNLIEKQSKEIEEINKENLEIRDWKYVIDSPIDLDKLKELDLIKIKGKEYVSKDKIKAKIEEVEYKMIAHQDVREAVKQILQSLLEKE